MLTKLVVLLVLLGVTFAIPFAAPLAATNTTKVTFNSTFGFNSTQEACSAFNGTFLPAANLHLNYSSTNSPNNLICKDGCKADFNMISVDCTPGRKGDNVTIDCRGELSKPNATLTAHKFICDFEKNTTTGVLLTGCIHNVTSCRVEYSLSGGPPPPATTPSPPPPATTPPPPPPPTNTTKVTFNSTFGFNSTQEACSAFKGTFLPTANLHLNYSTTNSPKNLVCKNGCKSGLNMIFVDCTPGRKGDNVTIDCRGELNKPNATLTAHKFICDFERNETTGVLLTGCIHNVTSCRVEYSVSAGSFLSSFSLLHFALLSIIIAFSR